MVRIEIYMSVFKSSKPQVPLTPTFIHVETEQATYIYYIAKSFFINNSAQAQEKKITSLHLFLPISPSRRELKQTK